MQPQAIRLIPAGGRRSNGTFVPAFDSITGCLLGAMIVFSPWAFGTTQPWSIRLMNAGGDAVGILFLMKCIVRRGRFAPALPSVNRLRCALLVITGLVLLYVFVAALNAEFTYVASEFRRDPRPFISWLPHSLDQQASWRVLSNWLALAGVFWSAHDWLTADATSDGSASGRRLRWLVGVLAMNGALVAFEGILQRTSGTGKLLWFQTTHDNPIASAQFGPYAYRANAAQFFNLIWPPALALWWHLHFKQRVDRSRPMHHWLLPAIILLTVAPLVSTSRGGVAVTLIEMCGCGALLIGMGRLGQQARVKVAAVFMVTIAAAVYLGGNEIVTRFRESVVDPLSGRAETYRLAAGIARDYPWFGVGPGAFDSVFQMYRNSPDDYWPQQLHNDWLEYRITFGRVGCALVMLAGILVAVRARLPGGVRPDPPFIAFIWIAIGGCLLHARFDFPLQIYSIQFVFVLLSAALFSLSQSRRSNAGVDSSA